MTRNKLICALSESVIVIQSGPERDASGRMSGTFNSGKNALQMGKKLFVLSPSVFNEKNTGNTDLIKLGGKETFPDTIVTDLLNINNEPGKDKNKKELTQLALNFNETDPGKTNPLTVSHP